MRYSEKAIYLPKEKQKESRPERGGLRSIASEGIRRISRNPLFAGVCLAFLILGVNLGISVWIHDPRVRALLLNWISPVVDALVCAALFTAAKYSAVRSRHFAVGWGMIALSMLVNGFGDLARLVLEVGLKTGSSPIADCFYLASYPAFLAGVFLLLEKPATTGELIKRSLDMAIVLGSAILGFWNFLIWPIASATAGSDPMTQAIALACPVGDMVLIGALFLLLYYPSEKQEKASTFFLLGSLLIRIIADSVFSYQSLLGIYVRGSLPDLGWIASILLVGLAGVSRLVALRSTDAAPPAPRRSLLRNRLASWPNYVPLFWMAAVFALLIRAGMGAGPLSMSFSSLALGVGGIIGLFLVRQTITLSENSKLNVRLQKSMDRIQAQAEELEKANLALQNDIAERNRAEAARQRSETLSRELFNLSPDAIVLIDPYDPVVPWSIVDVNRAACTMNRYTREEMVGKSIDLLNVRSGIAAERDDYLNHLRERGVQQLEAHHRRKDGTTFDVEVTTSLISLGGRELILGIDHDITQRKRAEREIHLRLAELEAIQKVSTALRAVETLEEMLPILMDKTLEVMQAAQGSIWLYNPARGELSAVVSRGYDGQAGEPSLTAVKPGRGIVGRVFAAGQPYVSADFREYPNLSPATRSLIPPGVGGAAIPIRALDEVIGTLLIHVPLPRELTSDEVHLLTTLSEIAGSAIRRITLHQQTDHRLRQLTALSRIDHAISSSMDLRLNLITLLQQVIDQLGIPAADVLVFNPVSQSLEYAAGNGFSAGSVHPDHLHLGKGYAGQAALERRIVHIPDLSAQTDNPFHLKDLSGEAFESYYGVPLLAKGQVKGVLEIFQHGSAEHDAEWLEFLNTLAGQAAIAIDNATLFDNLQRTNLELSMAYDATIEGWSKALDLRDRETEGHTKRVTDISVRLARSFGLSESELIQIRWGSLLHDIGKMGIPDEILHKPGPLTEAEWAVMRRHPEFAYEMLSPIHYLRLALDIPYHHHEKWDGSGYPQGLKGEQIPLAARIFAVIDVWDALRSDRPYRRSWPEEKVREHLRSSAGTHFDPQVVKAFLESAIVGDPERDEREKKK